MMNSIESIDFNEIQGLCTWLDFTDKNQIIFRTGSNVYINTIKDKSRYKNNFIQANEPLQPLWNGVINNKTCANFLGTNYIDGIINSNLLSLFNADYEMFFLLKTNTTSTTPQFLIANTTNVEIYEIHLGVTLSTGCRFIPTTAKFCDTGIPIANQLKHVVNARITNNIAYTEVDGVVNNDPETPTRAQIINLFLRIGARYTAGLRLNSQISQVLIFNRQLTAQERAVITSLLTTY